MIDIIIMTSYISQDVCSMHHNQNNLDFDIFVLFHITLLT